MATISVNYDSNGDVELILKEKTSGDQPALQDGSSSTEQQMQRNYVLGNLHINVKEVRLQVSSEKLISSSCYFQAMFEGTRFREAEELKEHGLITIELSGSEDDPTAMMIILGILYSNDVQVPIDIDLQTLHNVATLVDKYQFHATVSPQAVSWFNRLKASQELPDTFDETLLMRLWVAWVFRIKDRFKELSRVAQQCATKPIDPGDEKILLPSGVLKDINSQRETGFQKIEQELAAFKEELINDVTSKESKNYMLKCMVFGHATFFCQDLELSEFAAPDHAGSSIRTVLDRIKSTQYTNDFFVASPSMESGSIVKNGLWDLKHRLEKAVEDMEMDKWGIECANDELWPGHQRRKNEV
ncbi:hypothetical protein B0J11DRAFT_619450 [Dendryphion nanum]|uniref:BTB domain-containing protein n=1 Tax=Dendryphion nanum TaxID=256645 RepID=A0A9P9D5D1_9PLEO|nr:hypothetical protein B0J11DRAFT_619450 [Dendryphion nanum]